MSASYTDRKTGTALRSRHEVFKATRSREIYSIWNSAQISLWAQESGRARDKEAERRDHWRFPALLTPEHHRQYDEWLNNRFPVGLAA